MSVFYEPIRNKIISTFKEQPLVPTRSGEYAPAIELYRGSASIIDVIDDNDLSLLTNQKTPLWTKNAQIDKHREIDFLDSLEIKKWGKNELENIFKPKSDEDRIKIETWISNKPDHWLMKLYALLRNECVNIDRTLRIIRTTENDCVTVSEVYFLPDNEDDVPKNINFVKRDIYDVGDAEKRKEDARNFLSNIGVKTYSENEKIRLRLKKLADKYSISPPDVSETQYLDDIKEFCAFKNSKELLFSTGSKMLFLDSLLILW